jgi:hypothetical protein
MPTIKNHARESVSQCKEQSEPGGAECGTQMPGVELQCAARKERKKIQWLFRDGFIYLVLVFLAQRLLIANIYSELSTSALAALYLKF